MISFSIRRPVTVAMLYLAVGVLGVVAWLNLPVEMLPETELPRLRVSADWRGASPEATEAFLTSPLEAAIQQVRGVEKVTSVSEERSGTGAASIDVEFARGTDMDFARLELTERLGALEEELPDGAGRPRVEPYVPQEFARQSRPFLSYTITGPHTPEALRRHLDESLAPELRQLEGVAAVTAWGGRARVLEIELDEARVLALGLTPEAVRRRMQELEFVRDAGVVRQGGVDFRVALRERAASPAEVRRAPLLTDHGRVVRLDDVAAVHDTYEEPASHYRIDGRPAVAFQVAREIGTNAVAVAGRVKARVAELERAAPAGSRVLLDDDESETIRAQLTDLRWRALSGAAIVFVVLLCFLRSFRSAVTVFASIAFAVLITLNLVYFGGLTLNVLTLMGLAMGFGLVIDNAVVVLENIYRLAQRGMDAAEAAERGSREMVLPVLAATMTTIIVFLPFVYLQGEVRLFYVPLAVVVGFTNLASLFVTFTLTPALAGRLLRAVPARGAAGRRGEPIYARLYAGMVRGSLRRPWTVVALSLAMLGGSYWLFQKYVATGTVWRAWSGEQSYVALSVEQPRGEELAATDGLIKHFEARLRAMPEVARFTTQVYPQAGRIRVEFADSLQATPIPRAIKDRMEAYAHGFGGSEVRVDGFGPSFHGGGSAPPGYSIQVLGYNYQQVRGIAEALAGRLAGFSRVHNVDTNSQGAWHTREKATEVTLAIDRRRLALHGLSARDVVERVSAAVGRQGARSTMRVGDEEVSVAVRLAGADRIDLHGLRELLIPSPSGQAVRLGDVAAVGEREMLSRIVREDQQYQRTVSYEFRGPAKLGDRVHESVMRSTDLPPGYRLVGRGESKWSDDERQQILGVLAFSLVLVFMMTAALFESLRQPLCVLFTVPMALIGVFLLFFFTGASFTREAFIGVIMMGGVVTNNATLLVDHINSLRRGEQLALEEAITRGTMERVRPILMTSAVTILGLLPLVVFSEAADANIWNALGYSLLGGLASSTILVLTATPALYLLFERGPVRRAAARAVPPSPVLESAV
jgi:HAE1 family hydrophobic/amphiphilic exporter-1